MEKKRKKRETRAKSEAENVERARAWSEAKAREKVHIARISAKAREKVRPEAKVMVRAKEKVITANMVVVEAGSETRFRVEAKAEVRDRDVDILTDILKKDKAASNISNGAMVGAKEETKEKAERSRAEVEAEERETEEEEEAALQDTIQAKMEYWDSQEMAMIE